MIKHFCDRCGAATNGDGATGRRVFDEGTWAVEIVAGDCDFCRPCLHDIIDGRKELPPQPAPIDTDKARREVATALAEAEAPADSVTHAMAQFANIQNCLGKALAALRA